MAGETCPKATKSVRGGKKSRVFAAAAAAFALASLPATAQADITPITVVNGIVSTVGGCQSADLQAIIRCTQFEFLTRQAPLMLDIDEAGKTIVVLGAGLYDDGSMRPMLVDRLNAALTLARRYPAAPIVTSGGVPRSGVTEARAMRNWLVDNGIAPHRITEEDRSRSTIENAANTVTLLAGRRTSGIVVVSSPNHVERALVNFRNATAGRLPVSGVISAG